MIRNSDIDRLRGLFAKRLIATMDMLKKTVGTVADLTVFRKLRELDYCTSYSHRGRFYTLRELAEFDENGEVKTEQGTIVGTLHYMSPEQATGKTVDARSDIFALGIVFYEMLTGARPFTDDTPGEVLSSVVKNSPTTVKELDENIPRELSKIVQRCLAKDPSRRLQNPLNIRNELDEIKADLSSGGYCQVYGY